MANLIVNVIKSSGVRETNNNMIMRFFKITERVYVIIVKRRNVGRDSKRGKYIKPIGWE
jgi:hypothetical protein